MAPPICVQRSRASLAYDVQLRCWGVDDFADEMASSGKLTLDKHVHVFSDGERVRVVKAGPRKQCQGYRVRRSGNDCLTARTCSTYTRPEKYGL